MVIEGVISMPFPAMDLHVDSFTVVVLFNYSWPMLLQAQRVMQLCHK